jgi:hypothetical protein
MNPKSEKEMFTRVAIFDTYCQTTHYKKLFKKAHTDISKKFKLYTMFRDGITANSYTVDDFIKDVNKIVDKLQDDSLVPHELGFTTARDKTISDWGLYPISTADHLPFDGKHQNGDSGFETLTFDIDAGLDKQLKAAKIKLQEKRDIHKKSFQNSGKVQTSSYKLDDVLSHLECLVFRENETGSVKDVSKKFGMSHHTFRDKCEKAEHLIDSKIILRFFPK